MTAPSVRLPGSFGVGSRRRTGPRGRHGFPLDQVAESRRLRLLDGFVAEVDRSGFAGTRVAQVCRTAGASTKAFYDAFGSKEGCLLGAFDLGAGIVCDRAVAAFDAASGPWGTRVQVAVEEALGILGANPPFARLALLEVPRLGHDGLARLDAVATRFLDRLGVDAAGLSQGSGTGMPAQEPMRPPAAAGSRPSDRPPHPPRDGYRGALVAGAVHLLAGWVERGDAERLAELAPAMRRWLPRAAGIRAWTGHAEAIIDPGNAARSFAPASAVVQLGPSPDDAQRDGGAWGA